MYVSTTFSTAQPDGIRILCNCSIASDHISQDNNYTIAQVESNNYVEICTSAVVYVRKGATLKIQEKTTISGGHLGGLIWIQIPL